jgi:hypothetical protein
MATEDTAFRRLMEMGRERGFVTLDQVNATLPVNSMSQTELAETLDRLERSGVSVEVDEELTRRHRRDDGDGEADVPDFRLPEPPEDDDTRVVPLRPRAQPGAGSQGRPAAMTEAQDHRGADHKAAGGESTTRTAIVIGVLLLLIVFAFVLLR